MVVTEVATQGLEESPLTTVRSITNWLETRKENVFLMDIGVENSQSVCLITVIVNLINVSNKHSRKMSSLYTI